MFKKLAPHLRRGRHGEKQAERYLRAHGLTIVEKNLRTRRGEIDLIMRDGETLVFVEVRLRQQDSLVSAAESLNPAKRKKWKTAAQEYLQTNYPQPPDCRFDAVLVTQNGRKSDIEWIKGLFL